MADRDIKDIRNTVEDARRDPVRAVLVFLNLLEREADRRGQFDLAHAKRLASQSNAGADLGVDVICRTALAHLAVLYFGQGSPQQALEMTSDRDVYAAGLLMIKRYGEKAWFEASLRSDALREKNDKTGVGVRDRICKATASAG